MLKLKERKRRKTSHPREQRPPGKLQRVLGWCVHGYTASGLVAAGLIAVLLVRGGPDVFRWSFLLMVIATIVDSTDGTLARKIRIKEAVPSFDGRRLDDIVDFLTYTFLPLLLIYRADSSGRAGGVASPAVARECLRLLPGSSQDRRRLFPWLSLSLESRRVLSLRSAAQPLGVAVGDHRAGNPDLRADPSPLPFTAWHSQPGGHHSRCHLDPFAGLGHLAAAYGQPDAS